MRINKTLYYFLAVLMAVACKEQASTKTEETNYMEGTFGYDLSFLQKHDSVVVLKDGDAQVIVSPNYPGGTKPDLAPAFSIGFKQYCAILIFDPVPRYFTKIISSGDFCRAVSWLLIGHYNNRFCRGIEHVQHPDTGSSGFFIPGHCPFVC